MSDVHQYDRSCDARQMAVRRANVIHTAHRGDASIDFLDHVVGIEVAGEPPPAQLNAQSRFVRHDVTRELECPFVQDPAHRYMMVLSL